MIAPDFSFLAKKSFEKKFNDKREPKEQGILIFDMVKFFLASKVDYVTGNQSLKLVKITENNDVLRIIGGPKKKFPIAYSVRVHMQKLFVSI
jgi:hypothetical protein